MYRRNSKLITPQPTKSVPQITNITCFINRKTAILTRYLFSVTLDVLLCVQLYNEEQFNY